MTDADYDRLEANLRLITEAEGLKIAASVKKQAALALAAILELREENRKLRRALKEIAMPALGGKQQQYLAQAALAPPRAATE